MNPKPPANLRREAATTPRLRAHDTDPVTAAVEKARAARLAEELQSDIGRALRAAIVDRDSAIIRAKRLTEELAECRAELAQALETIERQRRIIDPVPPAPAPEPVTYCPRCGMSHGYASRGDVPETCPSCGAKTSAGATTNAG